MTIIGLSDLHGRLDLSPGAEGIIARADLLLLAGDITHFEGAGAARKMVERLRSIQPSVLAVPGNCDHPDVIRFLEEEGISLHGRGRPVGEIWVYGAGGSLAGPLNTPLVFSDAELTALLGQGLPRNPEIPSLAVVHQPPFRTKADRVFGMKHVGSPGVRTFLLENRPLACLSGHIHESPCVDSLDGIWIANPGPLGRGGYIRMEWNRGSFTVERLLFP